MTRSGIHILLYFICSSSQLLSQGQNLTEYEGRRAVQALKLNDGESVRVDGRLDEPFWERAAPASDFRQQDPDNRALATERTEVRVIFDQNRLYLGVECLDSEPDKLHGNQMQRDRELAADDRFAWSLDPSLDGRSGYFFEVNPSGAMGDGLIGPTGPTGAGTLVERQTGRGMESGKRAFAATIGAGQSRSKSRFEHSTSIPMLRPGV